METITEARRPLLLAGGGVIASEAWYELIRFAERLSIPVVTSSAGKSAIPADHPLAVGVVGNYSRKVANDVASKCDTYIVIGSDLSDHTTKSRRAPGFGKKMIHIDLDPNVLGANYEEEVSVVGDAKLALQMMIEAADNLGTSQETCAWKDWVIEVKSMVMSWQDTFRKKSSEGGSEGAINPYFIMMALNRILRPDDIVVADTGYMAAFANACIDIKSPGRKYLRTAGTLGWGFPAALGAQIAVKDQSRVFCITGDGGFGYHATEVETAVRYGLPVIVLLLNNSSLAFEYHIQKILYKDIVPLVNDFLNVDYGAVARAFDAYGENITQPGAVAGALTRALDAGKPAILNFRTDKEIYAPVVYYESAEERKI
jgi:acetolactate synthase-1/2/3 large subunit